METRWRIIALLLVKKTNVKKEEDRFSEKTGKKYKYTDVKKIIIYIYTYTHATRKSNSRGKSMKKSVRTLENIGENEFKI